MPDFKLLDGWRNCALAAGAALVIGAPSAAPAQGSMNFFGSFFGFGNEAPQRPLVSQPAIRRATHSRRHAVRHQQSAEATHAEAKHTEARRTETKHEVRHRHHWTSSKDWKSSKASIASPAYCVRLCDGRYFQLAISTPDKASALCGLSCPDAAAQVFFGDGSIQDAETVDGRRYDALPNAFAYRSRLVDDCSCKNGAPGMAPVSIEQDPTLEQGDIVVTRQGPVVFQGTESKESRPDFTPVSNYREIESEVRRYLATLPVGDDH